MSSLHLVFWLYFGVLWLLQIINCLIVIWVFEKTEFLRKNFLWLIANVESITHFECLVKDVHCLRQLLLWVLTFPFGFPKTKFFSKSVMFTFHHLTLILNFWSGKFTHTQKILFYLFKIRMCIRPLNQRAMCPYVLAQLESIR